MDHATLNDGACTVCLDSQQSRKNRLTHFVWFRRKRNPFPPMQCWSESCCQKPCQISLNGAGRIMIKARNSAFYRTMSRPIFSISVVRMGNVVINCIKCANFFNNCRSNRTYCSIHSGPDYPIPCVTLILFFIGLQVTEGALSTDTTLGSHCGFNLPSLITSTGNVMGVHFTSNNIVTYNGFRAVYNIITAGELWCRRYM